MARHGLTVGLAPFLLVHSAPKRLRAQTFTQQNNAAIALKAQPLHSKNQTRTLDPWPELVASLPDRQLVEFLSTQYA